ncbi:hypothetical protein KY290_025304 [Solanum tuberosum]|uniref:Uncharacterized protein n=1 Tax=Solanum tuberosum TaxID=4113 RepID=A0ABQ7UV05_SOLTU|nr:hypothetical protein KY290_025304 [Solanum tuberosum]
MFWHELTVRDVHVTSFNSDLDPKLGKLKEKVKKLQSIQQAKSGVDIVSGIRVRFAYTLTLMRPHLWDQTRRENGELCIGVRPAMRQQGNAPSSVISSHSMHLGVLATAWHAIQSSQYITNQGK